MNSIRFNATVFNLKVNKDGDAKLQLEIPLSDVSKVLPLAGLQENLIVEVAIEPSVRRPEGM